MRISVKRLRSFAAAIGMLQFVAVAPLLTANDELIGPELIAAPVDEIDRWIPSLSIDMGLMIQESNAAFLTGEIKGPWVKDVLARRRIRTSAAGKDRPMAPLSSVTLEFMTAGLRHIPFLPDIEVPGSPRLFAHGEVIAGFPHAFRTAKNGDVDDFALGFIPGMGANSEQVISGQGGTVKSRLQRWQFAGGAGIAITTDLLGRRLRIKPSFEYLTQEIEVSGAVHRAVALTTTPFDFSELRFIVLRNSKTKRFHGMGAGIEFEFDTRRAGPLLLSLYGNARGYRLMGDLDIRFQARNVFDEQALFDFSMERYTYRTAIGIRVRFAPE